MPLETVIGCNIGPRTRDTYELYTRDTQHKLRTRFQNTRVTQHTRHTLCRGRWAPERGAPPGWSDAAESALSTAPRREGPMAAFRAPWLHSGPHGSTAGPMAALRARNSRRCPGAEKASAGKRDSASSRRRPAPAAVRTTGLTMLRLLTDTHHTGSPPSTVERAGACATGR